MRMTKQLFIINVIFAITDTLIAALGIIAFAMASFYFQKWWVLIFMLIPIALFNSHSLLLDRDIIIEEGDDNNSGTEE